MVFYAKKLFRRVREGVAVARGANVHYILIIAEINGARPRDSIPVRVADECFEHSVAAHGALEEP